MSKILQIFLAIVIASTAFTSMTNNAKAEDIIILDSLWNEDSEIYENSSKVYWTGMTLAQRFTITDNATITSISIFGAQGGFPDGENPMIYCYIYAIDENNLPIGSPLYSGNPIPRENAPATPDFAEVNVTFNSVELSAGTYAALWTIDLWWFLALTRYDTEPENNLGNWYNNTSEEWFTWYTFNYKIYGYYPTEEEEGGFMESTHFFALIPLLVFLILSMIWYGRGLLHIMTFAYTMLLAVLAISEQWELLFFAPIAGVAIISVILFSLAMMKGDWL